MLLMDDQEIIKKAITFANKNKKVIAQRYTDKATHTPEVHPISVFMAGSPGAGKTESAKELIEKFSNGSVVLHIDPDNLRSEFEDYSGNNSSLFQGATSILVDKIHDLSLNQKQSFVFDGTLSNLGRSIENIERSLKRDREVFIIYVYQDPVQAWGFVKKRAQKDGRFVPKDAFISQYFSARENVNNIKSKFGKKVNVHLVVKNIDGSDFRYVENIDRIDSYVKEKYSEEELNSILD